MPNIDKPKISKEGAKPKEPKVVEIKYKVDTPIEEIKTVQDEQMKVLFGVA